MRGATSPSGKRKRLYPGADKADAQHKHHRRVAQIPGKDKLGKTPEMSLEELIACCLS